MRSNRYKRNEKDQKSIAAATAFDSTQTKKPPEMLKSLSSMSQSSATTNTQAEEVSGSAMGTNPLSQEHDQEQDREHIAEINPGKMLNATVAGHEVFKSTARFTDVHIHGPFATGGPGCLSAINCESYIFSELASSIDTPADMKMARAVSETVAEHLEIWKNGLAVPHLHWYPMFQFMPVPYAPPIPSIPSILANCSSFGEYLITNEHQIYQSIMSKLPSDMENDVNRHTIQTFSEMVTDYFDSWLGTSLIINVLGGGPVPAFAPPFVLGGPVVGKVIPTPGVLS